MYFMNEQFLLNICWTRVRWQTNIDGSVSLAMMHHWTAQSNGTHNLSKSKQDSYTDDFQLIYILHRYLKWRALNMVLMFDFEDISFYNVQFSVLRSNTNFFVAFKLH